MKAIRQSMTARLAIYFGLIALVVFSGAGVLIYQSLVEELDRANHEELVGKTRAVMHFIDEAAPQGNLTELSHHIDDMRIGHDHLRVWLLSEQDEALYGDAPVPIHKSDAAGAIHALMSRADVPMIGQRVPVVGSPAMPVRHVLVALDLSAQRQLLASHRNTLVFICAVGIALAVALGVLATWRGTRPVKRISAAADRIAPNALAARLPTDGVDRELIDLTRAFNKALDRVELAYRRQEAFNANVAHELRTPLSILINGAQVTLNRARSNQELRDALESNLEDMERLNTLVNDMLFLARADQGDKALGLQLAELTDEAQKAIDYFEPVLQDAHVSAACTGHASTRCNVSLVQRALLNLLSNAVKHTPAGQSVTVRIESTRNGARISVHNPGSSLQPGVAEQMFDRFYRADPARVQSGDSTGLGLAIVRAVARMHHGDVFVDSGSGGVTVGFTLATDPQG